MLLPLIEKIEREIAEVADVRGDAGYVSGELLSKLNKRGVRFAFRLPKKGRHLMDLAEAHSKRPPGRPTKEPRTWCAELTYQAGTWDEPQRVILVSQERPGELFLHTFSS